MDLNFKKTEENDEKDKNPKKIDDEGQPKPDDCKEKMEEPEDAIADESLKMKVLTAKDSSLSKFTVEDVEATVNSAIGSAPTSPSGSPGYSTVSVYSRNASPLTPPKLKLSYTKAAEASLTLGVRSHVTGRKRIKKSMTKFPIVSMKKTPNSSPKKKRQKNEAPIKRPLCLQIPEKLTSNYSRTFISENVTDKSGNAKGSEKEETKENENKKILEEENTIKNFVIASVKECFINRLCTYYDPKEQRIRKQIMKYSKEMYKRLKKQIVAEYESIHSDSSTSTIERKNKLKSKKKKSLKNSTEMLKSPDTCPSSSSGQEKSMLEKTQQLIKIEVNDLFQSKVKKIEKIEKQFTTNIKEDIVDIFEDIAQSLGVLLPKTPPSKNSSYKKKLKKNSKNNKNFFSTKTFDEKMFYSVKELIKDEFNTCFEEERKIQIKDEENLQTRIKNEAKEKIKELEEKLKKIKKFYTSAGRTCNCESSCESSCEFYDRE